jgi:ABC-type nitrate/sulfonate/bicarbonate transport system substrate-binding protein
MRTSRLARLSSVLWLSLLVAFEACAPAAAPSASGAAPAASGPAPAAAPSGDTAVPGADAASAPQPQRVKMSYVNALDNAPLFVGVDRGYWQEQGIDLETEALQSAADGIAFLANGQLDAAMGSIAVPLYVDSLLDQQRVHIAERATTYTEPLSADRLIDTALADYALQQLGRQ